MFEVLSDAERDALRAKVYSGVVEAARLACFAAPDATLFDSAHDVQRDLGVLHRELCQLS
jgi:hypothetical protein